MVAGSKSPKPLTRGGKGAAKNKPVGKGTSKSPTKNPNKSRTGKKGRKKGKKSKRKKKGPRCLIKRRKKALKRKCYSMTDPRALLNTYYTCHGVVEMLKFRKFKWKKKKKK